MNLRNKLALSLLVATAGVNTASAAVPAEVTTAITDFTADAALYGAAFIGLAVAVSTAKIGIKWVKSFISKSS